MFFTEENTPKKPIYCNQCAKVILFDMSRKQQTFCKHYPRTLMPSDMEDLFGTLFKGAKK